MSDEYDSNLVNILVSDEDDDDQLVIPEGPDVRARLEIVRRVTRKKRRVPLNGKPVNMSMVELLIRTIRNKALAGNVRYCKLQEQLRGMLELDETSIPKGVLITGEKLDEDEWMLCYGPAAVSHEEFLRIMKPKWALRKAVWEAEQAAARNEPRSRLTRGCRGR